MTDGNVAEGVTRLTPVAPFSPLTSRAVRRRCRPSNGAGHRSRQISTQAAREGASFELWPLDRRAVRSVTDITCAVEAASMTKVAW